VTPSMRAGPAMRSIQDEQLDRPDEALLAFVS
jgi:hypothetical protein